MGVKNKLPTNLPSSYIRWYNYASWHFGGEKNWACNNSALKHQTFRSEKQHYFPHWGPNPGMYVMINHQGRTCKHCGVVDNPQRLLRSKRTRLESLELDILSRTPTPESFSHFSVSHYFQWSHTVWPEQVDRAILLVAELCNGKLVVFARWVF